MTENIEQTQDFENTEPDFEMLGDDRLVIGNRKNDHLEFAHKFHENNVALPELDATRFIHNALPGVAPNNVDTSVTFAGVKQDHPFFINAMTGGTDRANAINDLLATVAERTDTIMALGSMSIMVKKPEVQADYEALRQSHPTAHFIANLGAEHTPASARRVIDAVDACALQIHLNAAQELVMPEGSHDFTQWLNNIEDIVDSVNVPVIVKEVGMGLSRENVRALHNVGVRIVDVAGSGGTNFIQIENARRARAAESDYAYLEDWGNSTLRAVIEAVSVKNSVAAQSSIQGSMSGQFLTVVASGGVRNPLDMMKYLALGADVVGLSGVFLESIMNNGVDGTVGLICQWSHEIKNLLALAGCTNCAELRTKAKLTYPASLVEYARQRGLELRFPR